MAGSDKSQNRTWEPDGSRIASASWLHTKQKKKCAGRTSAGDDPDQASPKCKRPRGGVARESGGASTEKSSRRVEVEVGDRLDVRDEMSVSHDSTHKRQPVLPGLANGKLAVSGPGERRARDEAKWLQVVSLASGC
ncbi:hypothetical protein E4U14_003466 [Claviceps sp. LM454 group G7]|nr:hypothetical protein E4U14_003466 [Claviceps sp. LM454 group G7]